MDQALGTGVGFIAFLLIAAGGGLLIGLLARLVLPGPDPMSWPATLAYGLLGALGGGLLSRLLHIPRLLDIAVSVACAAGRIWFFHLRRKSAAVAPTVRPGQGE